MEELLIRLKTRLSITTTDNDALLTEHLTSAIDVINDLRQFTPTEALVVEAVYRTIAVLMAEASYNKIGAEGQLSHSENGVSRSYDTDMYPSGLIRRILPRPRLG